MNKNIWIVLGVLIIILIAGKVYILNYSKDNKMMVEQKNVMMENTKMNTDNMMQKNEMGMMDKKDMMTKAGSYESYTPEKISMASDSHNVVLFFRAGWCPSCKTLDADIKSNLDKIPNNLTILDVNYDNSSDLKKKYGVTYQHTLVQVDKDGNIIKKWSGSQNLSSLVAEIK